jgi:ABC-type multidrug transport system permease subunit
MSVDNSQSDFRDRLSDLRESVGGLFADLSLIHWALFTGPLFILVGYFVATTPGTLAWGPILIAIGVFLTAMFGSTILVIRALTTVS